MSECTNESFAPRTSESRSMAPAVGSMSIPSRITTDSRFAGMSEHWPVSQIAEWILGRSEVPSWPEIVVHVAHKHGVERSSEVPRRREELKTAKDERKRMVAATPRK